MSSSAITTVVTMMEFLPAALQEQVAEHLRDDYIADLQDEQRWETSFQNSQGSLMAAARKAKQAIADGQATPLDYKQL